MSVTTDQVHHEARVAAVLDGMQHFDERAIRDALADVGEVEEAIEGVVFPALRRVGELWESGDISVAHEHFASSVLAATVADWQRGLRVRGHVSVVVSTPPGEHHGLAALCADTALRSRGLRTVLLGPNTPLRAIADAVRATEAPAVLLVATRSTAVRAHERGLRVLARSTRVYIAGAGAQSDLEDSGVHVLAGGLRHGVGTLCRDLQRLSPRGPA